MTGTLRIHLTDADFRYVQFARSPDPMWEAILGLQVLTGPADRLPGRLRLWRRRARSRIAQADLRRTYRLLNDLAPADASYWPDFLTPVESEEGMSAGLQMLRSTPRARLARELNEASLYRPLPAWTRRLAAGDRHLLDGIAEAVRSFHSRLLLPDWSEVEATVAADRVRRMDTLEGGIGAVFGSFTPFVWRDPVLTAPYPLDRSIHPLGRGLRLIPSFFCHTAPVAIADPHLPPVVVFPVQQHPAAEAPDGGGHGEALARLLGANRARVLEGLIATRTTGALAARLALPASTVSGHLTVLRGAGLVASERVGPQVLHRLTPRGRHLLGR